QLDDRHVGSGTGKVDRIGPDPAADLQNLFASPPLELSEAGDMRLDEIFPSLDLVEIFSRAHRTRRMPYIARTNVPKLPYLFYGCHFGGLPSGTYRTLFPSREGSRIRQQSIIVVGLWMIASATISWNSSNAVAMTHVLA